ncbi:MAG: chorismate synthase [Casimicrobiaceae bacterium]|nr:chorismate synthase [Casimicrobiaceae bacterium]MDW8313199.1 chorismate synthase [Burkholderiales bacterium]
MAGNTLGRLFSVTTFGESHGPAIGCVIDGCPPGLELSEQDLQPELDRRKPGTSRHVTQRREADVPEILSGVYEGKTTGTPIAILIRNTDQRSKDYRNIAQAFRPGHADYTYWMKYGIRDPRGGGRSSARLTAPIVAAGAVAKKWLRERHGVLVRGYCMQIGTVTIPFETWDGVNANPFFAPVPPDSPKIAELEAYMDALRKSGDSCGARLYVEATGVPVGWGEPVFDRLDADIAHAMMGLNAVKGVEIGAGFASITQRGTEHSDQVIDGRFVSNNAGGVLGGISTGQPITVRLAIKPTSSIRLDRATIDIEGRPVTINTEGRHDPCVGIRATPIAEALLAIVLMDHALRHRAQCADVRVNTPAIQG